ncbi:hypothetical protein F7Q99_37015 [Streptomyces kaniharaensis]|uniref:Uncharacterized protein n=1 Tax=Streptomyces kaniharaensis TaxID=212423 RepID=A0A6N7L5I9_9ACTN|nr:hypothetical protein [Streptomyces kaniharaensis]MQS17644.1 hypothetical protein [Streptomyces kaniharaensis]
MKVEQARRAIGEAVSARILELFEADHARMRESGVDVINARLHRGPTLPGHNPRAVPPVPPADVVTHPALAEPKVIFTWKSEHGTAPYFQMDVPADWRSRVVHRGYAVIAGHPVTSVLEEDADGRPTRIQTVDLTGYFDSSLHGWRAWARDSIRTVDWSDPDQPHLAQPAGDPGTHHEPPAAVAR